jgi:hypothetical protein
MKHLENFEGIDYPRLGHLFWIVGKMYPHPPSGKGRHADPFRDILLYLIFSSFRDQKNPHPCHPHPFSKTEVYKMLSQVLQIPDEREIEMWIPAFGRNLIQVRIPAAWFFETTDLQPAAINADGVRHAITRGKKIFEEAKQKDRELFGQAPKFRLEDDFGSPPKKPASAKFPRQRIDKLDFMTWLRLCQFFPGNKAVTWINPREDKPTCYKPAKKAHQKQKHRSRRL